MSIGCFIDLKAVHNLTKNWQVMNCLSAFCLSNLWQVTKSKLNGYDREQIFDKLQNRFAGLPGNGFSEKDKNFLSTNA